MILQIINIQMINFILRTTKKRIIQKKCYYFSLNHTINIGVIVKIMSKIAINTIYFAEKIKNLLLFC